MLVKSLSERPQSGFPVSIGTGLALESILDPVQDVIDESRVVPSKVSYDTYNLYLFNISTLLRNLIQSIPYKELILHSQKSILETLLEEIDYLATLFGVHSLNASFYVNTYAYPIKTYPDKLRLATTDQQKHIHSITESCLKHFRFQNDVQHFSKDIKYERESKALLMSHIPWDLLSHGNFHKLDLIESHTGVIKSRKDWNTKYHKLQDRDMSFLPFMEYLLTTFGDSSMFKPAKLEDRVNLYESMKKKGVHPLMSEMSMAFLRA